MEKELLTDQDGFVQQLRELRKQLNAPGYIPIRTTHAKPMTKRGERRDASSCASSHPDLPHLRIQNANAISSPLTHGFPSITAFTGLMWALERNLVKANVPLRLHTVGVICHHHQEQTTQGYVRSFNLTRNPVDKDGSTAAIVEEGRIHLDITLVSPSRNTVLLASRQSCWATMTPSHGNGQTRQVMFCPNAHSRRQPAFTRRARRRVRPWMAVRTTRRSAMSNSANGVGSGCPASRWLDAMTCWLTGCIACASVIHRHPCWTPGSMPHASTTSRYHSRTANPRPPTASSAGRTWRGAGSGWIVPIPVGYAALSPLHEAGSVLNARDAATPLRFVESVYSMGEWISPHRLTHLDQLLWRAETDEALGLYRCRNDYAPDPSQLPVTDETGQEDDDEIYPIPERRRSSR